METPRSEQFDDIYFAVENGLAESRYVFLEQNYLPAGFRGKSKFTICETGFGTGLNFLCAWTAFEEHAAQGAQLTYISFEKFPLSKTDIAKYLAHWAHEFDGRLDRLVELYPLRIGGWHKIRVSSSVTLLLIFDDVNRALPQLDEPVDCWFLDGHAPAKNPDMWSDVVFSEMGRLSVDGSRFSTFTAAGFVRRGLGAVGFEVSKVRGYGHKRDMSVGVFKGGRIRDDGPIIPDRVAVIGGGIAGSSVAYVLQRRGITVDLFEPIGLASGASGNERGLFNPRFTVQRGNESDFYSSAFQQSLRIFETLNADHHIGYERSGSLHLVHDDAKMKRMAGFLSTWGWNEDHARLLDQEKAEEVCGAPVRSGGIFLPDAGLVSPYRVVQALAQDVTVIDEKVLSLERKASSWLVNGRGYDAVILCCAVHVIGFEELNWLPVSAVRGQITVIEAVGTCRALKTNLCYGGYASKPFDGKMVVGSTFQPWLHEADVRDEDHADVLDKLSHVVDGFNPMEARIVGARVGFRCASKDRVAVIGRVPQANGLYVSVAHGSHGLTSAVLAAEMIAAQMTGEVQPVPRNVYRYVDAHRFLDR
ncbi:MAG: FAD-dependent 5-carboxymethylaminomethyl-2-thiouridine(34) oxidoreductase MnmC [Pseudobdellovibrionaceae bacterium]|jgi:tRNA 5-methylaminomethyl-2-thiouridine biosynthesis bifunctional protein|nr:FAD-dependent 5-carboxymethylaminomethyl-2-thiouridine(34) oxidoreductase MnmC [Pseudobdellovibrionaceae bacterium]